MANIVHNTRKLREPNGRRPQRLKHRSDDRMWLDVIAIHGMYDLTGHLHRVSEDRQSYTTETVRISTASDLRSWCTTRGIPPLPGEGPNRKRGETETVTKTDTNNKGDKVDGNKVERIAAILAEMGGDSESVKALEAKLERLGERVEEVAELASKRPERVVVVNPSDGKRHEVEGEAHRRLADALLLASTPGAAVYLWGPAGTGKTSAAQQIATALGLPFHFSSRLLEHYSLAGFVTAGGETVRTPFREAWEHGGVFLLDEMDRSDPNAVLWLNAALANNVCAFPDGIVRMNPNFRIIATGNTQLNGASARYNGAAKQDASVADRFRFLHWPIDESLEERVYFASGAQDSGWLDRVRSIRRVVERRKVEGFDITPRATFEGLKLLQGGATIELALEAAVQRNCAAEAWAAILTEAEGGN